MTFSTATWIVPLLPLGGFLFNFLFGRGNRRLVPRVSLLAVGAALALSLVLAVQVLNDPAPKVDSIPWLSVTNQVFGHFTISVGTLLDPLSAMMLVVVTLVSFLVHLYSLGYMEEDPGLARFFMYLGLFTFSMLGLVVSPNLFQMYIFWELVGLCSYLLIGFYTTKPEANQACKKAFVVNRVGDLGMFLGILFLSYYLGTSDFSVIAAHLGQWPLFGPAWLPLGGVALLLFCGAVGKSAQFPLHVWLPDAMEGPTPVSALIHAATMVAAGVFMVARVYAVFDASLMGSVNAPLVVACVGGFTSLFAATIACTQFDIKRVLAYSTLSQLGYMVMALGAGGLGVTAGAFHLFTHAFFKALLFLGAGSVIHAVHSNDVRAMGGLRRKMPITGISFLVASLAISGIFPFAGFFSKDMILAALKDAHLTGLYVLAACVAFLTAFYMFRLYFLTFEGQEPEHGHPHESPWTMTLPLVVLAVLSLVAGLAARPMLSNLIAGLQIATTQPIRLEDEVVVESQWGRVQEINSTYVVLGLWDLRQLIVPLSYFIEKPFENWTRDSTTLVGSVLFHLGYTVPIERLRAKVIEIVKASPYWDGDIVKLQVQDAKESSLELRVIASARSSGEVAELRYLIRERVIEFLQREYPACLPPLAASPPTPAAEPTAGTDVPPLPARSQ